MDNLMNNIEALVSLLAVFTAIIASYMTLKSRLAQLQEKVKLLADAFRDTDRLLRKDAMQIVRDLHTHIEEDTKAHARIAVLETRLDVVETVKAEIKTEILAALAGQTLTITDKIADLKEEMLRSRERYHELSNLVAKHDVEIRRLSEVARGRHTSEGER